MRQTLKGDFDILPDIIYTSWVLTYQAHVHSDAG